MQNDIPINDYYKEGVIDFWTINNKGGWWTAIVLHKDPATDKRIVSIYRWQRRKGEWKNAGCVRLKGNDQLSSAIRILGEIDLKISL
jgi:hypothetical protein